MFTNFCFQTLLVSDCYLLPSSNVFNFDCFTMPSTIIRDCSGYEQITDHLYQEIFSEGQDEILFTIYGLKSSKSQLFLYHVLSLLFLGIPYLFFKSYPAVKSRVKYRACPVNEATLILVKDSHQNCTFEAIRTESIAVPNSGLTHLKFFDFQHSKYIWSASKAAFTTVNEFMGFPTIDDLLNNTEGLHEQEYLQLLKLYGPNKIIVEVKSYWRLFVEEVFNPFYAFQAFSVILWCVDDYLTYALCVVILTLFSSITSLIQTRRQSEKLHHTVESSKCHAVSVLRKNNDDSEVTLTINPEELIPGDLIVLPPADYVMPCDAVLLTGQAIVNESVLTGESVPVTKTALHSGSDIYNINTHKRHTLFAGTYILQTRFYGGESVLARVVRTGFDTSKGQLVKSILFPTPVNLQFYKDSLKFVVVLFCIALNGMIFCLYVYIERGTDLKEVLIRTLDIVTIVVPPALPAAMAVGTVYSQDRLKKLKIFCISPPRINICGKIKLACFDKTGTLTHDGLAMHSVIPCINDNDFSNPVIDVAQLDDKSKFVQAMACCHSLTRIGGKLNGDPLDLNMFEFTDWKLEEPGSDENARFDMLAPTVVSPRKKEIAPNQNIESPFQIGIVREFSFSSTLQCMSVICRSTESSRLVAFTKGAPEKLFCLCLRDTLPLDFGEQLSTYTTNGFRVIALAYKELPAKFKWVEAQKAKRDVVECDLNFLGFLIMQNPLKPETAPILRKLYNANIRTVMITGDNIMTAVAVARNCEMVKDRDDVFILTVEVAQDSFSTPYLNIQKAGAGSNQEIDLNTVSKDYHFAIDGRTWNLLKTHFADLIPGLLVRTAVFARFQPDQKTQVVNHLQNLDYIVSFVGDGANDCGALKAAHVGVSLSQAEASVAAPFTSATPDISCIVSLMLEGRCALVTSFATFKYMALYSLIQFISILILYKCRSILGDFQFLFIDLIVTTSLAVTLGQQGPGLVLSVKRPMSSLVSPKNLIPLNLQILTCALVQLGALYYLYQQEWFEPIPDSAVDEVIVSWENTVLFTVSSFQYVILAVWFCKGRPYRESIFKNVWFLLSVLSLSVFITWLIVAPCRKMAKFMDIVVLSPKATDQWNFRYTLLAFPAVHWLIAGFIETCIGDSEWLKRLLQILRCKNTPKNKYKQLLGDKHFLENLCSLKEQV